MGFLPFPFCILAALLSVFPLSLSIHSLQSYQKLHSVSLTLCPKQTNSTNPQCITFLEKLKKIQSSLLEESLGSEDEDGAEEESGAVTGPLLEGALTLLNALEDEGQSANCSDPGELAKLILRSLQKVSSSLSERNYDTHYLVLFTSTAIILGLLLFSQVYHCIVGHLKDRKVKRATREASRARALYSNLQQIHLQYQDPLLQRRE